MCPPNYRTSAAPAYDWVIQSIVLFSSNLSGSVVFYGSSFRFRGCLHESGLSFNGSFIYIYKYISAKIFIRRDLSTLNSISHVNMN